MVNGENAAGLPKFFIVQLQKRKLLIYYRASLKTYLFLSFGEELKVRSNKKMSF